METPTNPPNQENEFYFPDGFNALEKHVIEQKACCYCGSCVSVCPKECLVMGEGSPELSGECNSCGLRSLACPRTFLPMTAMQRWSFGTSEIPPLGTYREAVLASSNSTRIGTFPGWRNYNNHIHLSSGKQAG